MVIVSSEWMKSCADDQKLHSVIERDILMMAAPPPPPSYQSAAAASHFAVATATTASSSVTAASAAGATCVGVTPEELSSSLTLIMSSLSTTTPSNTTTTATTTTTTTTINVQSGSEGDKSLFDSEFITPASSTITGFQASNHLSAPSNNNSVHETDSIMRVSDTSARIVLICEPNSHPFQTRTISLLPNVECKVGRLIAKSKASETNAIFDCKVLSRNHAVLWFGSDGKFYVKDTKSSNGTFINDSKLLSDAAELHFGDVVKFGVDVLENSRKEVHGCIIACVKLYLPDGREAISIDNHQTARSQYTGEGRISFDEMHRLSLYMQETSQREKMLKSKLCNIQNVLDVTRKNSVSCWQSMICEDQLLHRIHLLENKLQFMEKNAPENTLRDEMFKLLDDKSLYQHSAKEALRKVYQERCDAMQMLSKVESAYTNSENECKILREQILNTKQNLQDVNGRLLRLEEEYNEYKQEQERIQQETKQEELRQISELVEKLREREIECEDYKQKISELLLKRAELLEIYQEKMEIDNIKENNEEVEVAKGEEKNENGDVEEDNATKSNEQKKSSIKSSCQQQVAKNSTILKWLKNSDLNKKEGSLDIFKAICNESDSSDESGGNGVLVDNKDFELKCTTLNLLLQSVHKNLTQLETVILEANEKQQHKKLSKLEAVSEEENIDNSSDDSERFLDSSNGKVGDCAELQEQLSTKESTLSMPDPFSSVNSRVLALREAFNELSDHMTSIKNIKKHFSSPQRDMVSVETQFQTFSPVHEMKHTNVVSSSDLDEEDEDDDDEEIGDTDDITTTSSLSLTSTIDGEDKLNKNKALIVDYQTQINDLQQNMVYLQTTNISTVEQMQIEVDELKDKNEELTKLIDSLQEEKHALEQVIIENKSNTIRSAAAIVDVDFETENNDQSCINNNSHGVSDNQPTVEMPLISTNTSPESTSTSSEDSLTLLLEKQMKEDLVAVNNATVQREEELILYKERLESIQNENLRLKNDINDLKLKTNVFGDNTMLKKLLMYGAIFFAIIFYFILSYF